MYLLENVTSFSIQNCHCTHVILDILCYKKNKEEKYYFKHVFHASFYWSISSSTNFILLEFVKSKEYFY